MFLFSSCVFISRSHENRSLIESVFLIRKSSPFYGRMYVTYTSRYSHRTRNQIQLWRKCSFDDEVKKNRDCKFLFSLSLSLFPSLSSLGRNRVICSETYHRYNSSEFILSDHSFFCILYMEPKKKGLCSLERNINFVVKTTGTSSLPVNELTAKSRKSRTGRFRIIFNSSRLKELKLKQKHFNMSN